VPAAAGKRMIDNVYRRWLFRPGTPAEATWTLARLGDLSGLGTATQAWSGVCEALLRHPDFLFTLPPAIEDATTQAERDRLAFVALSQRALGRPPTSAEFTALGANGFAASVDALFASTGFRDYYFDRIRLRIEAQGTAISDEPARLWTFITFNGRPSEEVPTAE